MKISKHNVDKIIKNMKKKIITLIIIAIVIILGVYVMLSRYHCAVYTEEKIKKLSFDSVIDIQRYYNLVFNHCMKKRGL